MGDILGIGTTHYPPGLVPDEYKPWPLARMLHTDPRIPAHLRDPASWPEPMRAEWGNDEGITAFKAHRARVFSAFRTIRDEIVAFRPDFILMWGDDQYENFQDDVIPPFCVLAYDTLTFQPFKRLGNRPNIWGEPGDKAFTWPGQPLAGRYLTGRLLEAGIDMPYAYRPLHGDGVAHAFANTLLYLDLDRQGFPYPVLPVTVNCYGSTRRARGAGARRGTRSARAVAAALLRARASHGPDPQGQPLARGPDGVVELVARVPDREESLSLPRSRG